MRKILFRGKRVDNGEWVEGFYIEDRWGDSDGKEIYGILQDRTYPPSISDWIPIRIEKETVGQYTGLTDKNGKKIFEGDILDWVDSWGKGRQVKGAVVMHSFRWCVKNIFNDDYENWCLSKDTHEIIGNIHDNPELLEEHNESNFKKY